MRFWDKLKNWRNYLIGWIGGYSVEEVRMIKKLHEESMERKEKIIDGLIDSWQSAVDEKNGWLCRYWDANERIESLENGFGAHIDVLEDEIKRWKEAARVFEDQRDKCMDGLKTVQAERRYLQGVSFDRIKHVERKDIVRQLGEAVYPYAQHFITSDGRYIVAVTVATEGEHGGE